MVLCITSERHLQGETATESLETLWAVCTAAWGCDLKPPVSPPGTARKQKKHYLHSFATFCNGYYLNLQQLKKQ